MKRLRHPIYQCVNYAVSTSSGQAPSPTVPGGAAPPASLPTGIAALPRMQQVNMHADQKWTEVELSWFNSAPAGFADLEYFCGDKPETWRSDYLTRCIGNARAARERWPKMELGLYPIDSGGYYFSPEYGPDYAQGTGMVLWLSREGLFDPFDFLCGDVYGWSDSDAIKTPDFQRRWYVCMMNLLEAGQIAGKPIVPFLSPRLSGIGDPIPMDVFSPMVSTLYDLVCGGDVAAIQIWDPQPRQPFDARLSPHYQLLVTTFGGL